MAKKQLKEGEPRTREDKKDKTPFCPTAVLTCALGSLASQTSALFFLLPPMAALMGFILRDERLTAIDMFGFALASFGVHLAMRKTRTFTA